MNNTKKIIAFTIVAILLLSTFGCTKDEQAHETSSLDFSLSSTGDANKPKQVPDTPVVKLDIPDAKLNPSFIYQPSEIIADGDLSFTNFKSFTAAILPSSIQADKWLCSDGIVAEDSLTLPDGKEFLFAEFDICNQTQGSLSCNVGSYSFIIADQDMVQLGVPMEAQYFSSAEDPKSKEYFSLTLAANEKRTITLGYIWNRSTLGANSLYYGVGEGVGGRTASSNSSEPVLSNAKCFIANI